MFQISILYWGDYYLIRALERDYFSLLFSVLDNEEWYYEDGHTWTHEEKTAVLEQLIDKRLNTLILHTGDDPEAPPYVILSHGKLLRIPQT